MWIKTYDGNLINVDKLASIEKFGSLRSDEIVTYCLYGTAIINFLGDYASDKNAICIFKFSDTNKKKVEYIYNHVVKKIIDSFSHNKGFICIPSLIDKYSKEFDAFEEG